MQLGDLTLTTVSGGRFRVDGGTMFGVVPRALWAGVFPPDEDHLIAQATNCLLIRSERHTILVDTGYGSRLSENLRRRLVAEEGDPLGRSLEAAGVEYDQVDTLILTHLHFDHVGGALRLDTSGGLVPAFPNAEIIVQRLEWERATAGLPELRAAYSPDELIPLADSGRLTLVEGDVELRPGVRAVVTGGHTRGHQALVIESDSKTAVYLADLCPTTRHLPSLWCLGYDEEVLVTRRRKPEILGTAADEGWLALFCHDPDVAAAKLVRDDRREFSVADPLVEL